MARKRSKIQITRFLVQLVFMASLIFSLGFIPGTRNVSTWLLPTVLLAGVFFCGWVCPFGAAQDWMSKLGRLLHLPRLRMPEHAQRYLQLLRYAFYLVSTTGITFALLKGPYNFSRFMRGDFLSIASGFIIVFLMISLFFDRPFCNYFCTGGARSGLFSVLRIFGIKRDTQQCRQCGQCSKACPMNIDVARTEFVRHPNCIGCMKCVSSCPKDFLKYGLMPPATKRK